MDDLRGALAGRLGGRTCVVGVGNPDLGDDAVGPCVAEALSGAGHLDAIVAGTTPERWMERLSSGEYANVLFVDAVEFGGAPGSAVLLEGREIRSRFPQISTHKISLGTLSDLIERRGATRVYVLGVKPQSLAPGLGLTPAVRDTAAAVATILCDVLAPALDACQRSAKESKSR
jgi:hydrogenase maturation protease